MVRLVKTWHMDVGLPDYYDPCTRVIAIACTDWDGGRRFGVMSIKEYVDRHELGLYRFSDIRVLRGFAKEKKAWDFIDGINLL